LIIRICCLPIVLTAALLTLSRNTSVVWTWIGSCKV